MTKKPQNFRNSWGYILLCLMLQMLERIFLPRVTTGQITRHRTLVLQTIAKYSNCDKNKEQGKMAAQTVERRCDRRSFWRKVENHRHWHCMDFLRLDISSRNSHCALHAEVLPGWSSHVVASPLSTEKSFMKIQKKSVSREAYIMSIVRRGVSYLFVLPNKICLDSVTFKTVMKNYQALGNRRHVLLNNANYLCRWPEQVGFSLTYHQLKLRNLKRSLCTTLDFSTSR